MENRKNQIKAKLEKYKNIDGYEYNCFYRALDFTETKKFLWQKAIMSYIEEAYGGLNALYNGIQESSKLLPLRKKYPMIRKEFAAHTSKPFPMSAKGKSNDLENSIKFHLIGKTSPIFGKFFTYEFPLTQSRNSGAIDCMAYNAERKELRLIEIKRFALGSIPENKEPFIRALLEVLTYRALFDHILEEETSRVCAEKAISKTLGERINLREVKIINCIFAPPTFFRGVDDQIKEFLALTLDYKTEFYRIFPKDEISRYPISYKKLLIDIREESLDSANVGIFWVIKGEPYSYKQTILSALRENEKRAELTGIIDSKYSHFECWEENMKKDFPNADFATYPRGRVVYDQKAKEHVIYVDECITNGEINRIVDYFEASRYRIAYDEHYSCDNCIGEKDLFSV